MMTKRDFFIVLIRVFALFLLLSTFFGVVPSLLPYSYSGSLWYFAITVLVTFAVLVGIFVVLLQHTGKVVDRLKLAKGYDDDRIELGNPNKVMLIRLAILFGGTYLIVDRLPFALLGIFAIFRKNINSYEAISFDAPADNTRLLLNILSIVMGYLLIANNGKLANWMERKTKSQG
jgi:hypothetical protein